MDQWILTEIKETTDDVKNHLTLYQPDKAALAIENFINLLSNWYIRRNRRRFWKSGDFENNQIDNDKFSAYETLYFVLVTLSKIMSPMIPFITEEIYTNLTKDTKWGKESVHLEDFPFFKTKSLDESELQIATRAAMKISSLGRSARSKTKIKVRQPINNLHFKTKETITSKYIEMILNQVSDEVNVKNVKHVNKSYQLSNILIKPNNSILGPRIGNKIGKLNNEIQSLNHFVSFVKFVYISSVINNEIQSLNHNELHKELLIHEKIIISDIELTLEDVHIEHTSLDNSEFIEDNNFEVSIETKLDNNLIEEGISREIIHNIQNLRKNSGFNISDKISMFYYGDEKIEKVIKKYQTHISEEILATKIMKCKSNRGSNIKFEINNSTISINIELS